MSVLLAEFRLTTLAFRVAKTFNTTIKKTVVHSIYTQQKKNA